MSRAATAPALAPPRHVVPLLAAFASLVVLTTDVYLPVLPRVGADLHTSDAAASATVSGVLVGIAVGQVVIGPLSDAVGRRVPLLAGAAAYALLHVLSALSTSIVMLLAVRVLAGLATAACIVVGRAVVVDLFPGAGTTRAFAVLGAVTSIVPVLAPVAGSLLALVMGWRGMFLVLAGLAVLLTAVGWRALPESLPPERRTSPHLGRRPARPRRRAAPAPPSSRTPPRSAPSASSSSATSGRRRSRCRTASASRRSSTASCSRSTRSASSPAATSPPGSRAVLARSPARHRPVATLARRRACSRSAWPLHPLRGRLPRPVPGRLEHRPGDAVLDVAGHGRLGRSGGFGRRRLRDRPVRLRRRGLAARRSGGSPWSLVVVLADGCPRRPLLLHLLRRTSPVPADRGARDDRRPFPGDFLWGVASAGHQCEGDNVTSDTWFAEHVTPTVFREPSGPACDGYELWREDVDLAAGDGPDGLPVLGRVGRGSSRPRESSTRPRWTTTRPSSTAASSSGLAPVVTLNHFTAPHWFACPRRLARPRGAGTLRPLLRARDGARSATGSRGRSRSTSRTCRGC